MALDIKNLSIRTVSGLVYAGLLVGAIILGPLAMAVLASVLAVGASWELDRNTVGKDNPRSWTVTWLIDAATLVFLIFTVFYLSLSCFAVVLESTPFWILISLFFLRFLIQVFIEQNNPLQSISIYVFQLAYVGVPLSLLVWIVGFIPDRWIVVCAVAMIWISDTGAYLVGSMFGRHRLFPRLSPKKSWEGFLGGLVFNVGFAFIYFYCFGLCHEVYLSNVQGWIFIGICVTAFATLGDLFESLLKRSLGIKDFGKIIPGHGGVLDRIDSLLCVVPCVLAAVFISQWMFGV